VADCLGRWSKENLEFWSGFDDLAWLIVSAAGLCFQICNSKIIDRELRGTRKTVSRLAGRAISGVSLGDF
jgi:hypothetical protein